MGLTMVAAVDFAGDRLAEREIIAPLVQLVIAELGAGKLGIAWSPPDTVQPTAKSIALRLGRGAAFGLGAAIVLFIVGIATHSLTAKLVMPPVQQLLVGPLIALLAGGRDELILRGLPIRILKKWSTGPAILATCAAAVMARGWFADNASGSGLILGACTGVALACVWLVDRGAWMAVGANAVFAFSTHLFGVSMSARPSAIGMGIVAACAVAWWRFKR
jgi:hypothetical protein